MLIYRLLPSKATSLKYNIICSSSDKTMNWQHGVFLSISQNQALVLSYLVYWHKFHLTLS